MNEPGGNTWPNQCSIYMPDASDMHNLVTSKGEISLLYLSLQLLNLIKANFNDIAKHNVLLVTLSGC